MLLIAALTSLLAHGADTTRVQRHADSLRFVVPRTVSRPAIDGTLDDATWRGALKLDGFVQSQPLDQAAPEQPSSAWVTYDDRNLYIAFRATERSRRDVRATVYPRERGGENDDRVTIQLDTYHDRLRAYVLSVNPLGIQSDGVSTEGRGTDNSPDFLWYSEGRIYDDGWGVELTIPWASLRFPAGDTLRLGVNIIRSYGRSGEIDSWSPRRRGNPCDICQEGELLIAGVPHRRSADVLPYVRASRSGNRQFLDTSLVVGGVAQSVQLPRRFDVAQEQGIGADVKLALSPSYVLNATVHPDFSQIEADEDQVRVNQRFALTFEEKRPFFLEGRDYFQPRVVSDFAGDFGTSVLGDLFYTRAIIDPAAGARLTGKSGPWSTGALYVRDGAPSYWWNSGYQTSSYVTSLRGSADVVVLRTRRDVLQNSSVGLIALGRRATYGGAQNGILGGDAGFRFGAFSLGGEGALSRDRASLVTTIDTTVAGTDTTVIRDTSSAEDGKERNGAYYRLRFGRSGYHLNYSIGRSGASNTFRDELGQFQRVGIERSAARISLDEYPNNAWLQRMGQSVSFSRTNAWRGKSLDGLFNPGINFQFQHQTSVSFGYTYEKVTLPNFVTGRDTALYVQGWSFSASSFAWRKVSGVLSLFGGEREIYDFSRPRLGQGYFGSATLTIRPNASSSLDLKGQRSLHYGTRWANLVDDAKILRLRGTYQFTRALGLRMIGEYSDQFSSVFTNPLTQRAKHLGTSALVSYEIAPGSFLYAGFNDTQRDFDDPVVRGGARLRTGSDVFLKISYLFRVER
ncbi:MAG: carbohydrate binding family 9 domain-containing protein [Gemmatimonadota bacterium]|nr:carbohydrate binding family 9 domain-containing protein [Gemmatimonadota bacterium]